MAVALDPATEERLARVRAELAQGRSRHHEIERRSAVLRSRTLELCSELREAVTRSGRRLRDIAQFARESNGANHVTPVLANVAAAAPRADTASPGLPALRLRRVLRHIDAALAAPLSVRALAQVAGMSPSHFTALFKRSTGVSPHEAVLLRRIARAKELLRAEDASIADIGCRLGFSSQAHFTTLFRRRTGLTPGAWRAGSNGAAKSADGDAGPVENSAIPATRPAKSESRKRARAH